MSNSEDYKEALVWSYRALDLPEIVDQEEQNLERLKLELSQYLDHLIATDIDKLIRILYRIDISQEKATAALANKSLKETSGETIASLIIARQLEKIETRRKYRNHSKDSENKGFSEEN